MSWYSGTPLQGITPPVVPVSVKMKLSLALIVMAAGGNIVYSLFPIKEKSLRYVLILPYFCFGSFLKEVLKSTTIPINNNSLLFHK